MSTAILIDGGFYRKVTWGKFNLENAKECANFLVEYCRRHLSEGKKNPRRHDLYRIFYYDCIPLNCNVCHPFDNRNVDLSKSDEYKWMYLFLDELKKHRKVALRLGELSEKSARFVIKDEIVKKLYHPNPEKRISFEQIGKEDFRFEATQKGVDMKIGIDIASLSYKKQVDQIVLISGDSDFVPAAKLARREGIDFVLDPLGRSIRPDLYEHIDGLRWCDDRLTPKK